MQILYSKDADINLQNCAVTVGFFDGVHLGHRSLINELKALAKEKQLKSMIITFSNHPRKVLHSDFQPNIITTLDEKLEIFSSLDIDICYVLDFDIEIAKYTALEFIKNILFVKLHVKCLLIGHDHRFGHNRAEGFDEYKIYGESIGIEVVKALRFNTSEFPHISSTDVRKALQTGDIAKANSILQYKFKLKGKVIDGFKVGRKIGFPTANIQPENSDKIIPALGVYAVELSWKQEKYFGMMNIGQRPTLNNSTSTSIEVHIFNFDQKIYNQTIEVSFVEKIRDEIKFSNINDLIQQLELDKIKVINILNAN